MPRLKQVVSTVLLASGVMLVFAGVTRSVGFSPLGIAASLAAVVALLYSGAVFFGSPPPSTDSSDTVFVFDRTFRLVSGPHRGLPIRAVLPALASADLESRCAAVLDGSSERLSFALGSRRMQIDAVPVRDASGTILYGMLILSAAEVPAADHLAAHV
jgi:hypothetical protein